MRVRRGSVRANYESAVGIFRSSRTWFTSPALQRAESHTLYVVSPSHEQRRLRPLFETLLQTVINYAFELSSRTRTFLDPPLLVVLDEAANIAPTARSRYPRLHRRRAWHSAGKRLPGPLADIQPIRGTRPYGVVNNHRAKIVLSGISETHTLEYASRLLSDAVRTFVAGPDHLRIWHAQTRPIGGQGAYTKRNRCRCSG
jgi:hypothetical protein